MLVLSSFEIACEIYEDKLFIWLEITNKHKNMKIEGKKEIKPLMPFIKCVSRYEKRIET